MLDEIAEDIAIEAVSVDGVEGSMGSSSEFVDLNQRVDV